MIQPACQPHNKPVKTAAEIETDPQTVYQGKLLHGEILLPDSHYLTSGWFGEGEGISCWPFLTYPDLYNYLNFNPNELSSTDLNDYINSKAYSYFNRGWLDNILYYEIEPSATPWFLKTNYPPSVRLNDPHPM